MNPLSAVFGAGVKLRNRLYDRGVFVQKRLRHPVISVGNVSVGGTGKTPFTLLLGRLLQQNQVAFDILSRGYGREGNAVRLVDAKGSAREFGDEPLWLARELEVPVIVGADRFAAGQHAERLFAEARPAHGRWVHLLDDGFQHRRLARQFDIVLVSRVDLEDTLLPGGRLREPLASLQRADAIVLTDDTPVEALPTLAREKHIWRVRHTVALDETVAGPVVAFCGVARPKRFFADLAALGITPMVTKTFSDHQQYQRADVEALLAAQKKTGATAFVTSAKDLINLEAAGLRAMLGKALELKLRMEFVDPDAATVFAAVDRAIDGRD